MRFLIRKNEWTPRARRTISSTRWTTRLVLYAFGAATLTLQTHSALAAPAVSAPSSVAPVISAPTVSAPLGSVPLPSGKEVAVAPVVPVTLWGNFNVLLMPLNGLAASGAPGAANETAGSDAAISVGAAQAAAAPLRRALMRRGASDVLMAAPGSSVLKRALAENRLSQRVLDALNEAMNTVVTSVATMETANVSETVSISNAAIPDVAIQNVAAPVSSGATTSGAITSGAITSASSAVSNAVAPVVSLESSVALSAQMNAFAGATQSAIKAASRLGQALNYRAVAVLATTAPDLAGKSRLVILLVDALRESGEVSSFEMTGTTSTTSAGASATKTGGNRLVAYQNSAEVGSVLVQQKIADWTQVPSGDAAKVTVDSMAQARAALAEKRLPEAREAVARILAFDASNRDACLLMGDIQLRAGEGDAAVMSFRRALLSEGDNGAVWTRIATAYAQVKNWPDTLNAGRQALANSADSVELRLAMATAQLGRARLFNAAGQSENANDAMKEANVHLTKARALAPDDPAVLRLTAEQMAQSSNARAALQMLDKAAPQMLADRDFQVSYATLLVARSGREADAFAAWMRAVQLSAGDGSSTRSDAPQLPAVDRARFRRLLEGYDQTVSRMTTRAFKITDGVVAGNVSRERAVLEIKPMTADIASANALLKGLLPPDDRTREALNARLEVGDEFSQALNAYELYAEIADDSLRDKAVELHKTAMTRLNALRAS